MTQWINRTLVQAARNGTNSHTVTFTAATAGSLLVALAEGPVTSTTPTGWTLPANGAAISNTGLYVWWKVASAGESSFSTTHNGTGYPCAFVVYEFPAGSTFVGSAQATGINPASGANPDLTGLTGTNLTFGAIGIGVGNSNTYVSAAWSGTGSPVEDIDVTTGYTSSDAYGFSLAYVENNTASSFQPTGAVTQTGAPSNKEGLTFAVNVPLNTTASPSAIATGETFGTPAAVTTLTVSPASIGPGEALGVPSATPALTAAPVGIAGGEVFGSSTAVIPLLALPDGIASGEVVGVPASAASMIAEAAGVASGEAFGAASAAATLTVQPGGIASGQAFGAAGAATTVTVLPGGVASGEALGVPAAVLPLTAAPAGIASGQAFGSPTSTGPSQTLTIKHREGGAWVERTGVPRAFSGGQWVPATAKYWTGSGWSAL
jgi:hypothetical protein